MDRTARNVWKFHSGTMWLPLAWLLGFAPSAASGATIEVLWYVYSHPNSIYERTIRELAAGVHTLPAAGGLRWKVTFFRPDSSPPQFRKYNVLVIQSGEPYSTGKYWTQLGETDTRRSQERPDYSGILRNKVAIQAARGERTFITGSDSDIHTIHGNTGHAPPMDPPNEKVRMVCTPPISALCWDGALGHLVNSVNWAASGRGLGIVSFVAGEPPEAQWWLNRDSFLRAELNGRLVMWGTGTRENKPVIPAAAQGYPVNRGLTTKGLANWNNSFHAGFSRSIPGYVPIVESGTYPGVSVAIATAKFAAGDTSGPPPTGGPER